jgi:hypothetical protein
MKHLDEVELRLERAADEIRAMAGHAVPPPPPEARSRASRPPWLVFAAAFGVVLVIGALPFLLRGDEQVPIGQPSTSTTEVSPSTTLGRPTTTSAPADCSAAGMTVPSDQDGLPGPVADLRLAIAEAAVACDYATLRSLADPELNTSFGGGGFDNIAMWEKTRTYPALALLVGIFETPYATQEIEGSTWYVWPSAFIYDTWDEIPETDLEALLTVYTQEELDEIATFGSYAGWRIGITEDGEWRFFVAGD